MAKKGAKLSPAATVTAEALVNDLLPLGEVDAKKMFGGYGVFAAGVMFALVDSDGVAHLRVGPDTQPRYETAASTKHGRMPYWSIPDDVLDDTASLLDWAAEALALARSMKSSSRRQE